MNHIPVKLVPETPEERAERLAEEAWEANREECLAEFEDWQRADYDRREDEDFANWLANKARWNAPNKYGDALSWRERDPLPSVDLNNLRKGQKMGKGWLND